jgi:hypothetical protein
MSHEKKKDDDNESHWLRNTAMAAGMAAPWAGRIGQEPLRHVNKGPEMDWDTLRKNMQPGDVLVTGTPERSFLKNVIGGVSGHPYGYHTSVVGPDKTLFEGGPAEGSSHAELGYDRTPGKQRVQILRPNLTPEEREQFFKNMTATTDSSSAYQEHLEKALNRSGIPRQRAEHLLDQAAGGAYDFKGGIRAGLRDLFVPKWTSPETAAKSQQEAIAAREQFLSGNQPAQSAERAVRRMDQLEQAGKPLGRMGALNNLVPDCVGANCSTLPATAMPLNKPVVPGKRITDVLPADFLRSKHMQPIGRYTPAGVTPSTTERLLEHAPTLGRLGVGAGLAAGAYGLSKWYGRHKAKEQEKQSSFEDGAQAALRQLGLVGVELPRR